MFNVVKVIIFSISSYVILFLYAKLLGKKQIAELDFTDYIVGITIGSIAAEWATEIYEPWYHFVIAISIFAIFSFIVSILESRVFCLKKMLRGVPLIIIYNGQFVYKNLKKAHIDVHDVLALCRLKGFFNLKDIAFAIFETNGEMSVLPKGENAPATVKDVISPKINQATLINDVIIGGKINRDIVKKLNKNYEWVYKNLKIKNKKQLKNILYATYDEKTNKFDVYKIDSVKNNKN